MNALTVALALLAAVANGAASVLQRRAAVEQQHEEADTPTGGGLRGGLRTAAQLLRHRYWLAGAAALVVSAGLQAGALAVGELSVVQPLLASELLFTLLLGSAFFRHRPDALTWLSFLMLAVGLALFMSAAAPSGGTGTADPVRWVPAGLCLLVAVAALLAFGRRLRGAPRATVLGTATAICFACTAALIKEVTGRIPGGWGPVFGSGYLYATAAVGLLSFLLLQSTLRAGTLAASQPALTLGDALVSVALGWALFGEHVALTSHVAGGVTGALLIAAGTAGLARSPAVAGDWDADSGTARHPRRRGRRGTPGRTSGRRSRHAHAPRAPRSGGEFGGRGSTEAGASTRNEQRGSKRP
ncbi:DMT family transporter [Streptomyces sp. NPDC058045]|uniref:DMT family transporter n=1 Tax=Streptomyces sp. NPDC058045 TaxID=3346311 RepID=UPI0036E3D788